MLSDFDLCKIVDSYYFLRRLEETTNYSGNVDILMSYYNEDVRNLCSHIYDFYVCRGDIKCANTTNI